MTGMATIGSKNQVIKHYNIVSRKDIKMKSLNIPRFIQKNKVDLIVLVSAMLPLILFAGGLITSQLSVSKCL